jgi:hypothetical protein
MEPRLRTVATMLLGGLLFLAALGVPGCDSAGLAVSSSSVSTTGTTQPTTTSSIVTTTMPSIVTAPSSTTTTVERIEFYTADWGYDRANVSYLAGRAEVIVRGRVAGEPTACWNSADGKQWIPKSPDEGPQFYTTWTVAVEEVLKGTVAAGDLVPFRFVGGTVEFNGRYAHYVGNDYPEMLAGDEVIIFGTTETRIQNTSDLPGYWILAGFAVFRLDENGRFVRMVPGNGPEGTDQTTIETIKYFVDHPGEAAKPEYKALPPAEGGYD